MLVSYVYGTRNYGHVAEVPGLFHVATLFFHINYVPFIPTGSHLIFADTETEDGFRGVPIGFDWRSVAAGYLRFWGGLAALALSGVAGWTVGARLAANQGNGPAAALCLGVTLAVAAAVVITVRGVAGLVGYGAFVAVSLVALAAVGAAGRFADPLSLRAVAALAAANAALLPVAAARRWNTASHLRALRLATRAGLDPRPVNRHFDTRELFDPILYDDGPAIHDPIVYDD